MITKLEDNCPFPTNMDCRSLATASKRRRSSEDLQEKNKQDFWQCCQADQCAARLIKCINFGNDGSAVKHIVGAQKWMTTLITIWTWRRNLGPEFLRQEYYARYFLNFFAFVQLFFNICALHRKLLIYYIFNTKEFFPTFRGINTTHYSKKTCKTVFFYTLLHVK